MSTSPRDLAREALERSLEVRETNGYDFRSPICVYDLCDKAGVKVLFVDDVSMEGVYAALAKPTIIISALRPLARRAFTCAHELGHHAFGHGSTIDELKAEAAVGDMAFQPEEFLANTFAGFLLMPVQGVKRAFTARGFDPGRASPVQIFIVACSFGVGYETLIGHLQYSLHLMTQGHADALRKVKLPRVRKEILGSPVNESLVIADEEHAMGTLDAEVGTLILLPSGTVTETDQIELVRNTSSGALYRALRPGLARVFLPDMEWGIVVRVSRFRYAGLPQYRHLEEAGCE